MEESSIQICMLCLNMIEDTNFEVLKDLRANMLRTVLPNFNLNNFTNRIICCNCISILQELYNFKMSCANSEDRLKTLISVNEPLKVNLNDIKELLGDVQIRKGQKMCRLCLNVVSGYCANMNDKIEGRSVQSVLKRCIPEQNMDLTNKPLVCQTCLVLLKKQLTFMQHCLILEEKINLYCRLSCKGSPEKIDLYNILQFFEKTDMENDPENNITNLEEGEDKTNPRSTAECIDQDYEIRENEKFDISGSTVVNIEEDNDENEETNREEEINLPHEERQNEDITEQNSLEPTNVNSAKNFACAKCSYTTECESNINWHMQQKHKSLLENSVFRCNLCQFETNQDQLLRIHMFTHRHRHNCEICDISFKRKSEFKDHMLLLHNINADIVYKCQECSYSTDTHWQLTSHERTHKDISEVKTFKCKECDFQSKWSYCLNRHVLRQHNSSEECMMHKCDKCDYSTMDRSRLRVHDETHSRSKDRKHKCDKCEFSTNFRSNLKRHDETHTSKDHAHKCDKCEFSTNFRSKLRRHDETHTSKDCRHKCDKCEFSTHSHRNLIRHDERNHNSEFLRILSSFSSSFRRNK